MKHIKLFFGLTLCALLGATACQDSFDNPVLKAPQATKTPNSTILEVKEKYWQDAKNYIDTVRLTEAGEHVIISGRVVSSDAAGNIYKSLVVQDATAALSMSINANSMYNNYRIGQEIVIDLTDMYLGKYNGLQQLGFPDVYRDEWEATFMPLEFFKAHAELNGLPEPSKVDTITTTISALETDAAGLRKWQSQLVRFNNVYFEGADGELKFTDKQKESADRKLVDKDGASITLRNSGYANFYDEVIPQGNGDVVGILSFYGDKWQLLLRSLSDCMNFGHPTIPPGSEDNPYSVDQAIELQNSGTAGWVKGYIVGAVAPEVEEITSNDQIEWTAPTTLANTLVIGATPETKDIKSCLVIALPQDSKFREVGNLKDHPELLKREIQVLGKLETYMGVFGVTGNRGTVSEFKIEGVDPGGGPVAPGDGSKEKPYNVAQVQGGASGTAWIAGFIVGYIPDKALAEAKFDLPATSATNILIAASATETDYNKCVPIQLPTGDVRSALNLVDNPSNLGKSVKLHGSLEKYFGVAGLKSVDDYVLEGGGPTPEPPTPVDPVSSINEDFQELAKNDKISKIEGWTSVVVHGNKDWYIAEYTQESNRYAACTAYKGTDSDGYEAWMITAPIAVAKLKDKVLHFRTQSAYSGDSKLEVYVLSSNDPTTATKTKLNATIAESPASGYSQWVESGDIDLSSFSGNIYIGFVYTSSTSAASKTICVDDIVVGEGSTPEPPVEEWVYADFNTFNGGKATSTYGKADTFYSTASGWKALFCNILSGSAADPGSNPAFHFISDDPTVLAPCMTGNKNNPGSIVSPALPGGYTEIKFKYGLPYTDTKIGFKFTIYASVNGSLAKLDEVTISNDNATKQTAYEYTYEGSYEGNFILQFDNLCPSGATSNKDRVAIWDVCWKKY